MNLPEIVSADEWRAAHADLLAKEKQATRARDALAAERRHLPMVEYRSDYSFEGPDGPANLVDLFEGRIQLIVYHFMYGGSHDEPCSGCAMFTDQVGHLAHFHARDTSFALVSPADQSQIRPFQQRMGWTIPWYSTRDDFNADCGIRGGFGLSVFVRDGDHVYRSYFTAGRGVEALGSVWTFLDLTPLGRQEDWEEAQDGRETTAPYTWWQLHDEYDRTPSRT
jgi:predicted dithiol-disulfide oxidoreductase (DUF899 family)